MRARVATLVLILAFTLRVSCFDSRYIVFTIISQEEPYNAAVAFRLKQDIENQIQELEKRTPKVHLTHKDFKTPGAWTIIPLLRPLLTLYQGTDVRWVIFIEAHTAVRCAKLIEVLSDYDIDHNSGERDVIWIGYPLRDEEPTIINHFTIYENGFVYPNFASGFAMEIKLIHTLLNQIESDTRLLTNPLFSINPSFELAQRILGSKENPGPLLVPDYRFCVVSGDNCATYPKQFDICGSPVPESSILFAVKTWRGFHGTRVKVVQKTWGRLVSNLVFYSDVYDPSIPTENIGIPNTKKGHCAKTVAILKRAVERARNQPDVQWIFLADDDTILGVQRLCEILSCYRGGSDIAVLGERYGFGSLMRETASKGYNYITGGGGTVLSIAAADILSGCSCPAPDAADDMVLGACAISKNVTITHSPLFHQARPQDYPRELLARDRPVSFHRYTPPEFTRVYAEWFQSEDLALKMKKDEL